MSDRTGKITIRARPGEVEAIIARMQECFQVVWIGGANRLKVGDHVSDDIQRTIRLVVPAPAAGEETEK